MDKPRTHVHYRSTILLVLHDLLQIASDCNPKTLARTSPKWSLINIHSVATTGANFCKMKM